MVDLDRLLNDKDYEKFFDLKNNISIPNDNELNSFHTYLFEAAENDRKKRCW